LSYGELGRVGRRSGREMSNDRAPAPVTGEVPAAEPAASRAATTVRSLPLVAALTVCCALSACGSEGPATVAAVPAGAQPTTGAPAPAPTPADLSATTPAAPRSKRSTARDRRSVQKLPVPRLRGATTARDACHGLTAEQVRRRFLRAAQASASKRDQTFVKSVVKPSRQLLASASYPYAAARVYAMSVPVSQRAGAYAGCAYELSMKKESGR
jgi:hypothetical protein